MAHSVWSVQQAKDHFSEMVDAARQGEPQTITRHGKAAVVVMAAEDYARMRQAERAAAPSFIEHLLAMPTNDDDTWDFERPTIPERNVEF